MFKDKSGILYGTNKCSVTSLSINWVVNRKTGIN